MTTTLRNPPDSIFPLEDPPAPIYPFKTMEAGTSFYCPIWKPTEVRNLQALIRYHKKHLPGTRFRHKVYRDGKKAYAIRIWRTA